MLSTIQTLPASIEKVIAQLEQTKDLNPGKLKRIMREANIKAEDLVPWADYEHPTTDSYGRKLVYKGDQYEIMVMSWSPGDFSTIHDHGFTQWGAVQVFGPAEHATFRAAQDRIHTLARWQLDADDIIGVGHELVHQMGNNTEDQYFLTLHIYGVMEQIDSVTGDARIFDLENNTIQRVDGGVFFALPAEKVNSTIPGPKADFPTRLRHMTELTNRLLKMTDEKLAKTGKNVDQILADAFSIEHRPALLNHLEGIIDQNGHHSNSIAWKNLIQELKAAAKLQKRLDKEQGQGDHFHKYAALYDAVIGRPCLDGFMRNYLQFFVKEYDNDLKENDIISLGCGTGLVEEMLIHEMGVPAEQLYGIDISKAMVTEARKRINADQGNVLELDPEIRKWDIAFSGLNVFHYLNAEDLEEAIQKTASILKDGGFFIGDFITPDHIRWYPNAIHAANEEVVSLRTPRLIEKDGRMYQESEIVNINFMNGLMEISYAGKHQRFLPPMNRMRAYFEKAFKGKVSLYDARSLEPISDWADSCPSTRYIIIAEKA